MKRKMIAVMMLSSMLLSVASCDGSLNFTEPTTEETTVATTTTGETTTEVPVTETTQAAVTTGKYEYTIFKGTEDEMTLSMDIDLNDYILVRTGGDDADKALGLMSLATDLGWLEEGQYTYEDYAKAYEEDPSQDKVGFSYWYTFSYGDHRVKFDINGYESNAPGRLQPQIREIWFTYIESDSMQPFFKDGDSSHKDFRLMFDRHYDKISYHIANGGCSCSHDDAVILAYALWYFSKNPSDSGAIASLFEKYKSNLGGYQLP